MLSGCRALDFTDEKGFLCGKILADLGVDVIKVEKPGGDRSRTMGPFWGDVAHSERSLYWFAYNSNKRGITLDVETADGRRILGDLVKKADFVIESFPVGYLDHLGIGYAWLSTLNRGVILTSISPFGQAGPYRHLEGPDIVAMGMAGALYLTGDLDRPPVNISLPQSYLHAGADAAVGSLIAYYHRQISGEGQHVDVSLQQSTAWFLANAIPFWELHGVVLKRSGALRSGLSSDTVQRQVWSCRDGYVFFVLVGGKAGAKTCRGLVEWMEEEGMATEHLKSLDWENLDLGRITQEEIDRIAKPIEAFFLALTRREILQGVVERHLSVCPLSSMSDLLSDGQLKARDFWVKLDHPELGTPLAYPRQFVKSSQASGGTQRRAPLVGEHNDEIYSEIGLSKRDLVLLAEAGIV